MSRRRHCRPANARSCDFQRRQGCRRVMVKLGLGLLMRQREPDPELETVRARTSAPHFGTRAFRMDDAASRGHPIDVARSDRLVRS
jgi:hypothetical protein